MVRRWSQEAGAGERPSHQECGWGGGGICVFLPRTWSLTRVGKPVVGSDFLWGKTESVRPSGLKVRDQAAAVGVFEP